MVKARLPLYIHHCLKCKRFYPNRSDLTPIHDYRGWTTYLCPHCKRPVALVQVKWIIRK